MEKGDSRLFALPRVSVGRYAERTDPEFYRENLYPVEEKGDIPPGMYACRAIQYRCAQCGGRTTRLDPFLPVRDREKREGSIVFWDGELDDFLWRDAVWEAAAGSPPRRGREDDEKERGS